MERNIFKQEEIENIINQGYMHNIPPTTSDQTKIILLQLENNICKILIKNGVGTGFFCKIPHPDEFKLLPVLITNNHILNEEDLEINKNIKIAINNEVKIIVINDSRLVYTSKEFDVTIIEIKPEDKIKKFLEIDENVFDNDYLKIYKKNNINNNYIDSNNNNQERNNNIYNREIHANNYKIQSKYNQTQKNAPNNKKVDVIICSSCYSKKICCLCKNYSKNLFTITQSLKAHSICMKDKTCCICGHYGSGSHSIRICEICKKGRGKDIRSTKCFVCFNYLLV